METVLSSEEAANWVDSQGFHCTDVIGALWKVNWATGLHLALLVLICLKSHTFSLESSPPLTMKGSPSGFHEMTFTSELWASSTCNMLLVSVLVSQILTVASTPQELNTVSSEGDHWMSVERKERYKTRMKQNRREIFCKCLR